MSVFRRYWLPALVVRHVAAGFLVAPYLLPAAAHYAESGRRYMLAFTDWHLVRAYTWWKYRMNWTTFWQATFFPWGAWVAIALGALVGRVRGTLLWPVFAVYFVFGLFHGFGLATKLQDFALSPNGLVVNILSFNVGVELGQVIALALVLTVLSYWRTRRGFLQHAVVTNGVLMACGFLLLGYQLSGYFLGA